MTKDAQRHHIKNARVLLDKGYFTTKGAIYHVLTHEEGVTFEEIIEGLGISHSAYYRARRQIQEQQGLKIKRTREISLRVYPE